MRPRNRLYALTLALAACALLAAGLLLLANRRGAGPLWLGAGPGLRSQVEARLSPEGNAPRYDSAFPDDMTSMYLQPANRVMSWKIVQVRTENTFPLWESVLDDDPVYSLEVDLEVEYSNGRRARLRWTTWRYGLALGPVVISYGDGPPGQLSALPEAP